MKVHTKLGIVRFYGFQKFFIFFLNILSVFYTLSMSQS